MPYCMYLRKSRADIELEAKGELETLARHQKILTDLAKRMKIPITAAYKEIVSGESISARPMMQRLLEEVEQGMWTGVLVMEVERLARGDTIDQGIVARAFRENNTQIITPLKVYDPSNEYDEEYFEFGLFMSRREYRTINRRIQRGRVQSAKDGKYLGSVPPYGYDRIKIADDKGYTLVPNDEAEVVRSIYDWYLNGDGCSTIANRLDSMHIKPRNSDVWSKATIHDILSNPVYTGKIRWSYRQYNPKGQSKDSRKINDAHILVDGLHDAIISDDVFAEAGRIMIKNQRLPVKSGSELKNPLAGLGMCAKCGSIMTRLGPNAHARYATLKCSNRYCDNVSAPLDLVEQEVVRALSDALQSYQVKVVQGERPADFVKAHSLKEIRSDLQKIEKQIATSYDLLEQGVYTLEVFTERQRVLSDRKSDLLAAAENIEQEIALERDEAARLKAIPQQIDLLKGYWYIGTAKERNELLRQCLDRFEYCKTQKNTRGKRDIRNFDVAVYPRIPRR